MIKLRSRENELSSAEAGPKVALDMKKRRWVVMWALPDWWSGDFWVLCNCVPERRSCGFAEIGFQSGEQTSWSSWCRVQREDRSTYDVDEAFDSVKFTTVLPSAELIDKRGHI